MGDAVSNAARDDLRRSRPTVRALREDLTSGWDNPGPRRSIEEQQFTDLLPLSDLPHPLILKAAATLGAPPENADLDGRIQCVSGVTLHKVRLGQWRGAIYTDETGQRWLIRAGLAKGGHKGRDFEIYRLS